MEDITEKPERDEDIVGCRIFVTHFPAEMNMFYMKCVAEDRTLPESVDMLILAVGEIVSWSM